MTPGVAGYPGQFGNVLIKKESFDKFINTMVGVPVIINHKDINKENADDERVGVVSNVWFDDKDGWYWCDGVIWDETAQNLITEKGWSVSCSYDVKLADDAGGTENNIPYDIEFLDGVFTHLAIVDNPRYERANIVFNSKTALVDNDKWITIKPHGKDSDDYRRIKLEDGETPKEAIERVYGKRNNKKQEPDLQYSFESKKVVVPYSEYKNKWESGNKYYSKGDYNPKDKTIELSRPWFAEEFEKTFDNISKEVKEINQEFEKNKDEAIKSDKWEELAEETRKKIEEFKKTQKPALESIAKKIILDRLHSAKWNNADRVGYGFLLESLKHDGLKYYIQPVRGKDAKDYVKSAIYELLDSSKMKEFYKNNQTIGLTKEEKEKHKKITNSKTHNNILFDTEEYKGDSTIKPQTVHLYDVREVKNSSLSANVQPSVKNLKEESNNIITDIQEDFNPMFKNNEVQNWNEADHPRDEAGKFTDKKTGLREKIKENEIQAKEREKRISREYTQLRVKEYQKSVKDDPKSEGIFTNDDGTWLLTEVWGKGKDKDGWDLVKGGKVIKHFNDRYDAYDAWDKGYFADIDSMDKQTVQNNKEQDMALIDELKKLITKVENDKGENMDDKEKVENQKVDKRDIIRQIMAIAGKHEDNEDVRTIAKLAEKLAYDKSEAGTADNACDDDEEEVKNKKVKNEETEKDEEEYEDLKKDVKEDVKNKCKNSVDNAKGGYFDKMNEVYNSAIEPKNENFYVSRADRLEAGKSY